MEPGLPFSGFAINRKLVKQITMKKLLFVAFLGALVACGESTTTEETPVEAVETPAVIDSAAAAVVDSAAAVIDSAAAVIDSAVKH